MIVPNGKGNLYRSSDIWTKTWRMDIIFLRGEKEDQEGEVKTGQYVVLTDLTNGEMWTLGESIGGRGIQFEGKDEFRFGYVGSEKPVGHWGEYIW